MYIDTNTVISFAALATAIFTLFKYYNKVYKWVKRQDKQDIDIKSIQDEQCLICYGMLACLEGLKQLNCNGPVTVARDKLSKHLNQKAHNQEEKS